jgi:hypothetical protein
MEVEFHEPRLMIIFMKILQNICMAIYRIYPWISVTWPWWLCLPKIFSSGKNIIFDFKKKLKKYNFRQIIRGKMIEPPIDQP